MISIPWLSGGPRRFKATYGPYTLKWWARNGVDSYEVWRGRKHIKSKLSYDELISYLEQLPETQVQHSPQAMFTKK